MKTILILGLSVTLAGCASMSSLFSFGEKEQKVVKIEKVELPPMIYGEANLKGLPKGAEAEEQAVSAAKQQLSDKIFRHYQNPEVVMNAEGATEFERALTNAILAEIPKPSIPKVLIEQPIQNIETGDVSAVVKVTRAEVLKSQMSRLYAMDAQLRKHVHATGKGFKLKQLIALLPTVPVLMERRLLIADMEAISGEKITLPNERLASMMENQIERLMGQLVISLDAMTPESAAFESGFKKALAEKGFNMSARKPDLTFKYFIELEGQEVIGDIEMLNASSETYATVSGQYQQQAMESLAQESLEQLVLAMIESMKKIIKVRYPELIKGGAYFEKV